MSARANADPRAGAPGSRAADGPLLAAVRRIARPSLGFTLVLLIFLLFSYVVAKGSAYTQSLFAVAAVYAILAISLDLVAGVVGLYSLGHAGLFAIGAYATTLLANEHGWSVFVLLPVVVIGVSLVGVMLGLLSLRVSGLYFAITTFVFTLLISALLIDLKFTGGLQGLIGPLFPELPGGLQSLGSALVWATMLSLLAAALISLAIRRSPFYPVLLAIRDAEPFAAAAGARTSVIKVAVFGLSAALAGLAGWVFSFQGFISPEQFSWTLSVNILVMVILGGMNSLTGPIVGAAFIAIFPDYVNINPFWQEVLFGALLLVVIVTAPRGFVGIVASGARRLGERFGLVRPRMVHARGAQPETAAGAEAELAAAESVVAEEPAGEQTQVSAGRLTAQIARRNGFHKDAPAIECRGVVFSYGGGVRVLHGVDFVAARGTIHGLIGPNGSGKSTLVDLIAGRQRPDEGTISINGERLDRRGSSSRPRHGLMRTFQTAVMIDELSCRDNVLVGLYNRVPWLGLRAAAWPALPGARRDRRRMNEQAADALAFTGVSDWADAIVGDVPHGVEQLTQLAAACAPGPATLVLDEPVAGLSPSETERVKRRLAELRDAGMTILLIEHQPRFVFDLCDEVTVLNAGEVVTSGASADVRADVRVREVYLGQ